MSRDNPIKAPELLFNAAFPPLLEVEDSGVFLCSARAIAVVDSKKLRPADIINRGHILINPSAQHANLKLFFETTFFSGDKHSF